MNGLVSTDWLAAHLDDPDLVILDASLAPPGSTSDMRAEFERRHLPGARFLDLAALKSAPSFAAVMRDLGIANDSRILVYDSTPLHSATRGWLLLRQHGATRVSVLDGGLGKWLTEGRAIASGPAQAHPAVVPAADDSVPLLPERDFHAGGGAGDRHA